MFSNGKRLSALFLVWLPYKVHNFFIPLLATIKDFAARCSVNMDSF